MKVVGLFVGSNNLLHGKGALQRSTYQPKMIDTEEAYERQLAMLEKRSTYNYAYAPAFDGEEMPTPEPEIRRPEADRGSSTNAWITALSVAAIASMALMYQSRQSVQPAGNLGRVETELGAGG